MYLYIVVKRQKKRAKNVVSFATVIDISSPASRRTGLDDLCMVSSQSSDFFHLELWESSISICCHTGTSTSKHSLGGHQFINLSITR